MSEMSDDKKAKVLGSLKDGKTVEEASRTAGVSSRTVRRWCESDPEFAEAAAEARCRADDMVEAMTFANCLDPDPAHNTLRMFWLKSRRPEVYRETTRQIVEDERKSYDAVNTPESL